jgi:LAS superfamily LD-carboxypeptidase LdcB
MRIVEPKKYNSKSIRQRSRINFKKLSGLVILAIVGLSAVYILTNYNNNAEQSNLVEVSNNTEVIENPVVVEEVAENKVFSGNELRLLYDNILLPNTKKVNAPPIITGNDIADARIRVIAEKRGYKLRNVATVAPTYFEGYRLQDEVRAPWKSMQKSILNAGLNMSIVSAYRSVEEQRELFLSRLFAEGVNVSDIATGTADEQVDKILVTTALPGYSKHHSGYTVDLYCAGWIFEDFYKSDCDKWLTANNYENAKKYGFIPSYPLDADLQGPDPEAWEYVYIGTDSLIQ